MKITTYEQAEAATEAARQYYDREIRETVRHVGSERELSRRLEQAESAVHNVLSKGKFSALRRLATACIQRNIRGNQ